MAVKFLLISGFLVTVGDDQHRYEVRQCDYRHAYSGVVVSQFVGKGMTCPRTILIKEKR